jgi:hypothetical protein
MTNTPEQTPEERVRQRAYELWEQAGRPPGRSAEFWEQARAEVEAELPRDGRSGPEVLE